MGDVFHDGFRGVRIINNLERAGQRLRTKSQPMLRGNEVKAADAITGVHGPGVVEHVENAQWLRRFCRRLARQRFRLYF
jgi:hypothetical protein